MISILIPTWKNYECLKLCVDSIVKHTTVEYEICVYINEYPEKEKHLYSFLPHKNVTFVPSRKNKGISKPMNVLRRTARYDWLVCADDDFVFLPGWDTKLFAGIEKYGLKGDFWVCGTMIEPKGGPNIGVVKANYGRKVRSFNYRKLLQDYKKLRIPDHKNSNSFPLMLTGETWDKIGGWDEDVFARSSDGHFFMRAYKAGIREFIQIGDSLVYHFSRTTTKRVFGKNEAIEIFKNKYGISPGDWYNTDMRIQKI